MCPVFYLSCFQCVLLFIFCHLALVEHGSSSISPNLSNNTPLQLCSMATWLILPLVTVLYCPSPWKKHTRSFPYSSSMMWMSSPRHSFPRAKNPPRTSVPDSRAYSVSKTLFRHNASPFHYSSKLFFHFFTLYGKTSPHHDSNPLC